MKLAPSTSKLAGRLTAGSLLLSLALGGCGGSGKAATTTPKAIAPIKLTMAGVSAKRTAISADFTCDKHNLSLPLHWSGVPSDAKELVVLVANVRVVKGSQLLNFVNWGVAGLKPSLRAIPAGKLPAGSIVARNGYRQVGYSICPSRAHLTSQYAVQLLALSKAAELKPGFDIKQLVEEAEAASVISGRGQLLFTYHSAKRST